MRAKLLVLIAVLACTSHFGAAKTVFRRTDKISENFKKLDLPADEIDPNVAPPEPQKVDTIEPDSVGAVTVATQLADEVIDEAEEAASAAAAAAGEVIDETANEIDSVSQITASPAAASSASSAAVTAAPAAATPAETTPIKNQDDQSPISKYCKCNDNHCDCCRNFGLPLIPVRGPGCAKITYLGNEKMSVSIKYGDITLATRTISGKRARPICVGLPGGYSKFCGRVYGLSKAKNDFKACLGFELRAEDEVEAALRVSCFKFGPDGLRVAEAEPLPSEVNKDKEEEEDDDIFGFAAGGDDDDDDYDDEEEEEEDEADEDADEPEENDDDAAEAPEDADYGGFSLGGLLEELADDEDDTTPAKPSGATVVAAADTTRTAGAVERKDMAQSKADKDTEAAATEEGSGQSSAAEAAAGSAPAATEAPAVSNVTTPKSKKSKKSKKNKKKKAAAASENDFAFEILNGILDFFN